MSFLAKLIIDDKEYNVLSFSFGVDQPVSYGSNRPTGRPVINQLNILIESTGNSGFFGWSVGLYEQKDGEIIFYKRDAMASSRKLEFKGAFCVNYNESFDNSNSNPMVTRLVLAVESIALDGSEYVSPAVNNT